MRQQRARVAAHDSDGLLMAGREIDSQRRQQTAALHPGKDAPPYLVLGDEKAILDELTPHDTVETASGSADAPSGSGLKAMVRNLKGEAESTAIAQVLEETGWNRKAAANDLQISYKALLYKIKQYDLSPQDRA